MDQINLYSKTKEELNSKIVSLIQNNELEEKYRVTLKEWHDWFINIYEALELPKLPNNEFYRAFYSYPGYYAIQIWKISDSNKNIRQYVYTLYSNMLNIDFHEYQTNIVNSKEDIKKLTNHSKQV